MERNHYYVKRGNLNHDLILRNRQEIGDLIGVRCYYKIHRGIWICPNPFVKERIKEFEGDMYTTYTIRRDHFYDNKSWDC